MNFSRFSLLLPLFLFPGLVVSADQLNDIYNSLGNSICDKALAAKAASPENKSLQFKNSKLQPICVLTAKTALGDCMNAAAKLYGVYLKTASKEAANKVTKSSLTFCADYADLPATEVVNGVIKLAQAKKISLDEATVKYAADAVNENK